MRPWIWGSWMTELKTCFGCKETLSKTEFYTHPETRDGLRGRCKECNLIQGKKYRAEHKDKCTRASRNWRARNRDKQRKVNKRNRLKVIRDKRLILDYLKLKYGHIPCMDCSVVFPWCAMDFDHRPEEIKEFRVARMGYYTATPKQIAKVEKEISKCDLVCSNCHRVRTWDRKNND